MTAETQYLKNAIKQIGCVILVKSYSEQNTSRLEYISDNAMIIGVNSELVSKGLKLIQDYIHPEDRENVMLRARQAYEKGVEEYSLECRLVTDSGELKYVKADARIIDSSDKGFIIEYCITNNEITGRETLDKNAIIKMAFPDENLINDRAISITTAFANTCNLYTVIVDMQGKIVSKPYGPAVNLGDFYDLFEQPAYKTFFKRVKADMDNTPDGPLLVDREEGGSGKFSFVPLKVGAKKIAIWIIGSYTPEETEVLIRISKSQWDTAELVSGYMYSSGYLSYELEGLEQKLEIERIENQKLSIINRALIKAEIKELDSPDGIIEETMKEAGIFLNVDKIFVYTAKNRHSKDAVLRCFWDRDKMGSKDNYDSVWDRERFLTEEQAIVENGIYIIDKNNNSDRGIVHLLSYNLQAVLAFPIFLSGKLYGIVIFGDSMDARAWSKDERSFAGNIASVIQTMLENAEGDDNIRRMNNHLIEAYNNIRNAIFIRNAHTGEVLFSNTAMNTLVGYDFTGGNSRDVITDLNDRFDDVKGMNKRFLASNRVTSWTSYIKKFDMIMDITEIRIRWKDGELASFVIMKKVKELS